MCRSEGKTTWGTEAGGECLLSHLIKVCLPPPQEFLAGFYKTRGLFIPSLVVSRRKINVGAISLKADYIDINQ